MTSSCVPQCAFFATNHSIGNYYSMAARRDAARGPRARVGAGKYMPAESENIGTQNDV